MERGSFIYFYGGSCHVNVSGFRDVPFCNIYLISRYIMVSDVSVRHLAISVLRDPLICFRGFLYGVFARLFVCFAADSFVSAP